MAGARRSTLTRSDRVAVLERLEPGQVALRVGPFDLVDVLVTVHAHHRPAARRGAVGDLVADRGVSRGGRPARPVGAAGPGGVGTLGAVIVDPVERGRLPGAELNQPLHARSPPGSWAHGSRNRTSSAAAGHWSTLMSTGSGRVLVVGTRREPGRRPDAVALRGPA